MGRRSRCSTSSTLQGLSVSLHGLDELVGEAPVYRSLAAAGRRTASQGPGGRLTKAQERAITGRMVEEELGGSRESGIYSTSSGEEEGEEGREGRGGGHLVARLRRRSTKMGLLWQQRSHQPFSLFSI